MLKLRRIAVVTGLLVIGGVCGIVPALADDGYGSTMCDQMPAPVCDLGAGKGGSAPAPGGHPGNGGPKLGHTDSGGNRNSNPNPGDTLIGNSNLASCSYVKSDYQPPAGGVVAAAYTRPTNSAGTTVQLAAVMRSTARAVVLIQPVAVRAPGQLGGWYVWKCSGAGAVDALYRTPVWIPYGPQPGAAPVPAPADVAQMASKQLWLPTPSIAANPAGEQLVGLPTWMWLSSGWGSVSATAAVPGVSVTAVAAPTSVSWSMGDGSTVTCAGAGTSFRAGGDPKAASPDCGHTYRSSSASRPGHAFPVAATVHWTVTWSGAGGGGTFPDMTTTGDAAFRVAESQALNNGVS
jgi:hypothetical protein